MTDALVMLVMLGVGVTVVGDGNGAGSVTGAEAGTDDKETASPDPVALLLVEANNLFAHAKNPGLLLCSNESELPWSST